MKIPEFKPSKSFLGEFNVPCLVAEMKNSAVPEVATKYVAGSSDDPAFTVYLRVKSTEAISPWMQQKLEELFERDGLTAAIAGGLKKLDDDGYDFLLEHEREFVKTHGYHPCVYIKEIVLDEIKEKVLISLGDDSVLNEHGITIHLKAGRWRFADGDLFGRYQSGFEKYRPKPDINSWNRMFPKAKGGHFEEDCSMIFGRWVCDQSETDKLRKELGWPDTKVHPESRPVVISKTHIKGWDTVFPVQITRLERMENWITLEWWDSVDGYRNEILLWCDGRRLMDGGKRYRIPFGQVYLKVTD